MTKAENDVSSILIPPYGGKLVNLVVAAEEQTDMVQKAKSLPSIQISFRSVCDLELMATGAFSPLDRFMNEKDYISVLEDMRLSNGTLFPVPVTLTTNSINGLHIGKHLVLRSPTNEMLAIMLLEEIFDWDIKKECMLVLGTTDSRHPLVSEMHHWGRYCLSGTLVVMNLPRHNSFQHMRKTPGAVRRILESMGRKNVIAYQPRHAMHRAHEALTKSVILDLDGSLLIQPVIGMTGHNVAEQFTRVRCYQAVIDNYYDPSRTILNLLPLAVRMAGPRAGLWHGIINRNYGANKFIIGRDPHGPGTDSDGNAFYASREVQDLFQLHENEIGVSMMAHREMVYLPEGNRYEDSDRVMKGPEEIIRVSATNVIKDTLFQGKMLPDWFTYPEVAQILFDAHPPKTRQGFCVWLTGLPSSGKSTIAEILAPLLLSAGRTVTLLDGDVVRTHLTKGLGFSKEDRITNILRVGFVAAEIIRHEGVAICSLISPYSASRDQVRSMVGSDRFMEIFVDTPVEVCATRDVKGMYTMARQGKISGFTGVDDAYEAPRSPDLHIETVSETAEQSALRIMHFLMKKGYLSDGREKRGLNNAKSSHGLGGKHLHA